MKLFAVFFCLAFTTISNAQIVRSLGDLNPGSASSVFAEDLTAIHFQENLYFAAEVDSIGTELFFYNGDSIALVKDINPGSSSSEPRNMFELNGKLLFQADDGTHGYEWWVSDGTQEGTNLLLDIFEGEKDGVFESPSASEFWFKVYNDQLFFTGVSSTNNFEPWVTDGTTDGTFLLKNLAADNTSFNNESFPHDYVELEGSLYFSSRAGFWKTDGTTDGTSLVLEQDPLVSNKNFEPFHSISDGSKIYMLTNSGLWISNGTEEGTQFLKNIGGGSFNWFGPRIRILNGKALFAGKDSENGEELWESDGTVDGTKIIRDLWSGSEGYSPQNTTIYKDEYYFKGNNGASGLELFKSDGTASGTTLVKDIKAGSNGSLFLPTNIHSDTNFIYMTAGTSAFSLALWQSDGTADGTIKVALPNGAERPITYYLYDDKLFFFALSDDFGFEPYIYDPFGVPDLDMDGFDASVDCNDNDASINPGAEEVPNNDIDENCDGEFGTSSSIEIADLGIKIFPNPAQDLVYITTDDYILYTVNITDINGNELVTAKNLKQIDIADWANGTYFMKVIDQTDGTYQVNKLVKVGN